MSAVNAFHWADPEILSIFPFTLIASDGSDALEAPNTIIINESTAIKYFGTTTALGETLTLENSVSLRVAAVFEDFPTTTHFRPEALVGVSTARQIRGERFMDNPAWAQFSGTMAYLVIPDKSAAEALQADLGEFVERNVPDQQRVIVEQMQIELEIQPLNEIYFSSREGAVGESRRVVMGGVFTFAIVILLCSGITFLNLTIAQLEQRRKEVSIRKCLGAKPSDIRLQFLVESLLLTGLALIIALIALFIVLPPYTSITNTSFTIASFFQSGSVLIAFGFVVLFGTVCGIVPSLRMALQSHAAILKDPVKNYHRLLKPRTLITMVQFAFASLLVSLALGVHHHIERLHSVDIGIDRKNLVILDLLPSANDPGRPNHALIAELLASPSIISVGQAEASPPATGATYQWRRPEWSQDESRTITSLGVDESFLETMGIGLVAGRNFSSDFPADFFTNDPSGEMTYSAILTEEGALTFGFGSSSEALGGIVMLFNNRFRVVGVVNDFYLSGGVEPASTATMLLMASNGPMRPLLVRVDSDYVDDALDHIDAVWDAHRPGEIPNRNFFDQVVSQRIHEQTNGINRATQLSATIALILAVLGLYSFAYLSTQRRIKEIGIRKVLGGTNSSISRLLVLDFLKPVFFASLAGLLAAYFLIDILFSQHAFNADIPPLVSMATISGITIVAVTTIYLMCSNAARSDPVTCLRVES